MSKTYTHEENTVTPTPNATPTGASTMTEAAIFLDRIAGGPEEKHTFQVIPTGQGIPKILHGTLPECRAELAQLNQLNNGIFVCVNQTNGRGRTAANIVRVRALFLDLDGAPLEPVLAARLQPHVIVESSPGKWHAYYLVDDCALEEFSRMQRCLAEKFGGDAVVNDLPRVMRVPGFFHVKQNKETGQLTEPFLTRIEAVYDNPPYTVAEVLERLELSIDQLAFSDAAPMQHFSPDQPFPDGQRTQALTRYVGQLIGQGLSNDEALSILHDWNQAWCQPPLPDSKIVSTFTSIKRTDDRKKAASGAIPPKIAALNQEYAVVLMGGKAMVLRELPDSLEFMSPNDFKNFVANKQLDGRPIGPAWMNHPQRRTYNTVVFDPSLRSANDDVYNLWRGLSVEPRPGDCSLYLEHLRNNICAGDEDCYEYLLNWMAHLVQRPGELPGVAIVLKGMRGTGKGFFASPFGKLFGRHYRHVTSREHLLGKFNGHLQDAVLVFADEAVWAGNKEQEGVLKTLITESRRQYEQKYQGVIELNNYTRVIMATNNEWAVPAGLEERRFFVLQVSNAKMQDHAYFAAIKGQMKNGGREALLHILLNRDLSGVQIRKFPRTAALAEQQELSLDSVGLWWLDVLEEGGIGSCDSEGNLQSNAAFHPRGSKDWPVVAPKTLLYAHYQEHARKMGARHLCTQAIFGKKIREWVSLTETRPVISGSRVNAYVIPTLSDARANFDTTLGHSRNWVQDDPED